MIPAERAPRWLFSCEHGGREVPDRYAAEFKGAAEVLDSHRGWDSGALEVFNVLAPAIGDAAFAATTTRLLVDLNRSLRHPRLFSEFTRPLPPAARAEIIADWWRPWREAVTERVDGWLAAGHPVMHVSVHSFTPVLDGQVRDCDVGLLYDPSRPAERSLCAGLRDRLAAAGWRVRLNYPYRGIADGHTSALRKRYGEAYAGIELELNQALFPHRHDVLVSDLRAALSASVAESA